MRKKVLVIQNAPNEGLGTIVRALRRFGLEADYIRPFTNERVPRGVDGYPAVIILGGPMGVYEEDRYPFITDELRLVERAFKSGQQVLGICLGAQVLARAAGARVYKGRAKEIGWFTVSLTPEGERDRVFFGLPRELMVFHWHGDTFEIPRVGKNLASSELFPNQILRVGKRAYGIQFHLEITEEMIREWIEESEEELRTLKREGGPGVMDPGVMDPEEIIRETQRSIGPLHRYGEAVFSRFLRLLDL
jgi:GMP synthase-like glutamine amidotransferase